MLHIFSLNWNGEKVITELYNSLLPILNNIDCLWTIKDNGSSDKSVETIASWGKDKINLIKYPNNNQNFSEGNNFMFNEVKPKNDDFILLLNNDVVFKDTKSIHKMMSLFKDSSVGVVGARLLYNNTNKLQHAGVVFHNRIKTPMHFRLNEESDTNAEKNRLFQAVTGACLLTKAGYYSQVHDGGGMDPKFKWAFEDIDLCLSVKAMGKKIVYCGETNIFHEESKTLKVTRLNKLFENPNVTYFLSKWAGKYDIDELAYKKANYKLYSK